MAAKVLIIHQLQVLLRNKTKLIHKCKLDFSQKNVKC